MEEEKIKKLYEIINNMPVNDDNADIIEEIRADLLNGSYIDGMSLIDFTSEDSSSYKPPLEKPSFENNNGLDNFLDR